MSKSGSRYGRRSNWFKIHCLLQEQQQQQQKTCNNNNSNSNNNNNNNSTINNTSNENSSNSTSSPGLSISNGFLPSSFLSNLCNNNNNNNSSSVNNNNNNSIHKNNNTIKKGLKRANTPSDSGASSADLDEGGGAGDGSGSYKEQLVGSGIMENGFKTPDHAEVNLPKLPLKMSRTPPSSSALQSLAETYRPALLDRMSPYLPAVSFRTDGSPFFPVAFSIPPVSLALLSTGHAGVQICKRDEQSEPIDLSMKSSKSSSRSSSESPRRIRDSSPLLPDPSETDNQTASAAIATKTVPLDLSTFIHFPIRPIDGCSKRYDKHMIGKLNIHVCATKPVPQQEPYANANFSLLFHIIHSYTTARTFSVRKLDFFM
uniref:Protein embryonic gonad n=1 Tax=Anopheles minimus TaxID=112268 RepID=A0A182W3T3_9DIPT